MGLILLSLSLTSSIQDIFATTSLTKDAWITIANNNLLLPADRKALRDTCKELREFLTGNILLPIPISIQGVIQLYDIDRVQHQKYIQKNRTHCPTLTLDGVYSVYKDFFSFFPQTVQVFTSGELTASSLAGALESLRHLRHLKMDSLRGTDKDFIDVSQKLSLLSRLETLQIGRIGGYVGHIKGFNVDHPFETVKNLKILIASIKSLTALAAFNLGFPKGEFAYDKDKALAEIANFPKLKTLTLNNLKFTSSEDVNVLIHIINNSQTIHELWIIGGSFCRFSEHLISQLKSNHNNWKAITTHSQNSLSNDLVIKLFMQPQL